MDENELDIPMVSGAIGYLSYEYGRELMGIDSMEKILVNPGGVIYIL